MGFKKVVVVGGGVLGSQIAYQVAYKGLQCLCLLAVALTALASL